MTSRLLALAILLLVIAGGVSASLQQNGTPLPITPLEKMTGPRWSLMNNSGIRDSARSVIRDQKTWRVVWKRVNPGLNNSPLPAVNFSKDMLIVAALGRRGTGGYGIIVDKAYRVGKKVKVEVLSISPGKGCMLPQALTEPVDIVRIPRTNLPVTFIEIERIHDCE